MAIIKFSILKVTVIKKQLFYISVFLLLIPPSIFSQSLDELYYPKTDVHLGISLTKGSYIGTIFQLSNDLSFEASYGGNIGLFVLNPTGTHKIISLGANYHFRYFILNLSYLHFEEVNKYFSHIASMNIALFSIDEPGFHLIGALGGFYEFSKHFSEKQKEAGVNFNLALGFTVL